MVRKGKLRLIMLGTVFAALAVAADVMAIVGRPTTPFSYASVARRSVRRAYY
ncbi:MAG TPA: hypothetical protein VIF57_18055 [Polyangia bacterium]|jgi:hypothetical protein